MEREHNRIRVSQKVVDRYREITAENARDIYKQGLHQRGEDLGAGLGIEVAPQTPLIERLSGSQQGMQETPPTLPPAGSYDHGLEESEHTPTLLADSDGRTIRHGSAFDYWNDTFETLRGRRGRSKFSDAIDDEDRVWQDHMRRYLPKATIIAFPVHPDNIAAAQEDIASDGFYSFVLYPASFVELPTIFSARHAAALKSVTKASPEARANRGLWTLRVRDVFNIPNLTTVLVWIISIVIANAIWYRYFR